jgi:hypothetical protein
LPVARSVARYAAPKLPLPSKHPRMYLSILKARSSKSESYSVRMHQVYVSLHGLHSSDVHFAGNSNRNGCTQDCAATTTTLNGRLVLK